MGGWDMVGGGVGVGSRGMWFSCMLRLSGLAPPLCCAYKSGKWESVGLGKVVVGCGGSGWWCF